MNKQNPESINCLWLDLRLILIADAFSLRNRAERRGSGSGKPLRPRPILRRLFPPGHAVHRQSGIVHRASSGHWRIGKSPQIEGYYPWKGRGPTRAIASCGTSGPRTTNYQQPLQPPRRPVRAIGKQGSENASTKCGGDVAAICRNRAVAGLVPNTKERARGKVEHPAVWHSGPHW